MKPHEGEEPGAVPGSTPPTLEGIREALAACSFSTAHAAGLRLAATARESGDQDTRFEALLVAGRAASELGRITPAVDLFRTAVNLGEAGGRGSVDRARAVHHLGAALALRGKRDRATAAELFARAERLYGHGHPRIAVLQADRAWLWLDSGDYTAAVAELLSAKEFTSAILSPAHAHLISANLFVALAGAGQRSEARVLSRDLSRCIEEAAACTTWARVALAWGIALLGEEDEAARLAHLAREQARSTKELFAFDRATALLQRLSNRMG